MELEAGMNTRGNTGLKVIVIGGVIVFLFLFATSFGLKQALRPDDKERVRAQPSQSEFDGDRAFADLERVLAYGPRPAGSEALGNLRSSLTKDLRGLGLRVFEQRFEAETPAGTKSMSNLIAVVEGSRPGVIVLGNHYDTKIFHDFEFVGANDAGSTTAWMLEMARTLGRERFGRSIWLTWFDGEEAVGEWTETDSLYGSRHFVDSLQESGELDDIHAMINVDMIGDCLLRVMRDRDAPEWMSRQLIEIANRFGYRNHFTSFSQDVQDDHIPFRKAGIPALEIIDFSYGGTMVQHQKNWHTAEDTIDKVCAESLKAVGDVVYHLLPAIDAGLDSNPRSAT